jgi:ribosome maturation factor RimP
MDSSVVGQVWQVAEPLVVDHGMEIVDIEYRREPRGNVLRFYLDRPEGGVTMDELTSMSRRLGNLIDVNEVVHGQYLLEVSSPGINRRLRQPDHFRRYIGQRVRARCIETLSGKRAFLGLLREVSDDGFILTTGEGDQFIAFDNLAQANYEHNFSSPQPAKRRAGAAPR